MKINPGRHNFQIVFRSTCHFYSRLKYNLGEQIHFIASSQQKISVCPKRTLHPRKRLTIIFSWESETVESPSGKFLSKTGVVGCLDFHLINPTKSEVSTPVVLFKQKLMCFTGSTHSMSILELKFSSHESKCISKSPLQCRKLLLILSWLDSIKRWKIQGKPIPKDPKTNFLSWLCFSHTQMQIILIIWERF
jgi:hypothetical protein